MRFPLAALALFAAVSASAAEPSVGGGYRVDFDAADAVIGHAAADLKAFLDRRIAEAPAAAGAGRTEIVLRVDPALKRLQSKVEVAADAGRIVVSGVDSREVLQGCYRLEDEIADLGGTRVRGGVRTYTRTFSPRSVHSPIGVEEYPDELLDRFAHAGVDAVLVMIVEPPDVTRRGRCDLKALVERCRVHGLDVYAYPNFPKAAAEKHPLDPGARERYDELYGSIFRNAPGLRGLVAVGESCAFTAHDPKTSGFWWQLEKGVTGDRMRLNGFSPSLDWADWARLVADTIRKYSPSAELVFWTYNWYWAPEEERLALVEKLPTDVTLHVTFEMGDRPRTLDGVNVDLDDYSISSIGPGTTFLGEGRVAKRRGMALSTMANAGGRTWDYGLIPYEPAPGRWLARFRELRRAHRELGLVATMDCHHYGFRPSMITELAKAAFTEETDDAGLERRYRAIVARDWGEENLGTALAAFGDLDESFALHSAKKFDKYGPLRCGPAYPLYLPGEPMPPVRPEGVADPEPGTEREWVSLHRDYGCPAEELDGRLRLGDRELACIDRAIAAFSRISRTAENRRFVNMLEFMRATDLTLRNVRRFKRDGLRFLDAKLSPAEREAARAALLETVARERENVKRTLPLLAADPEIGFEPLYGRLCPPLYLEWKLIHLDRLEKRLGEMKGK